MIYSEEVQKMVPEDKTETVLPFELEGVWYFWAGDTMRNMFGPYPTKDVAYKHYWEFIEWLGAMDAN